MKIFSRAVLAVYSAVLLWLVLCKFSVDIPAVLAVHIRSLNVIPFAGSRSHMMEIIENLIVFVPLGLLLSANLRQVSMWRKLAYIASLSIAVETIQFILAIGVTDITDVIMNTLGGLVGLLLYALGNKHVSTKKLDACIAITIIVLLGIVLYLRFFVLRVRY